MRTNGLVVTLSQASLSLETTKFEDWPRFRQSISAALAGFVAALAEPPGEQRLGLRYVDRIVRPDVSRITDWTDWLQPWLLSAATHPEIGESISAMAQQIDYDAGDDVRVTLRQRAFADPERRGQQTVILDFDAFRDGYRMFGSEDLIAATDLLNDVSHRLFRAAITDRFYNILREESGSE